MAPPGEDDPSRVLALVIAASVLFLVLLVLFFFFFFARRWQWRLSSSAATPSSPPSGRLPVTKADLEKPLLSDDSGDIHGQISSSSRRNIAEESRLLGDVNISSPVAHSPPNRQRLSTDDNLVLNTIPGASEDLAVGLTPKPGASEDLAVGLTPKPGASKDLAVGLTLKRTGIANWPAEDLEHRRKEETRNDSEFLGDNVRHRVSPLKDKSAYQRSSLTLEVISGPSTGLQCSRQSTNASALPLTLGRISSMDLTLDDPGVSGRHAVITWNINTLKWEVVDTGSLNGTFLNSQAIHNPDLGLRCQSSPIELANGDIITLGTSSEVFVQIMPYIEHPIPFRVGMASDPMALRRGGKNLPMEDACYCQWPLPGVNQFGLFGIFDGHGGAGAAKAACEILPKIVRNSLSNHERRERILAYCDASEILKEAFSQTEAAMKHQYEGCTATVLLVWADKMNEYFAQCANVGDSACIMSIGGTEIKMTEDHRITSTSERARFRESGEPLEEGQTRLYGINIGRMLGDKFLKEQDPRFSSEPYISQSVHVRRASMAFALLASDGLWDVISIKRAVQLVFQAKGVGGRCAGNSAESIANLVLNEARTLRTKDNTSIIFLDFDTL